MDITKKQLVQMLRNWSHHTLLEGMQTDAAIVEKIWCFFKKLNRLLPYDSVILLLGTYQKELKADIQEDTCSPIFMLHYSQ